MVIIKGDLHIKENRLTCLYNREVYSPALPLYHLIWFRGETEGEGVSLKAEPPRVLTILKRGRGFMMTDKL